MGGARAPPPYCHEPPHRHVRLELPVRSGQVERPLLSRVAIEACRHRDVRRAGVLRGALRYRRGELHVLRAATRGGDARLGDTYACRIRVLTEALSEVHTPGNVPRGGVEIGARFGGIAARP